MKHWTSLFAAGSSLLVWGCAHATASEPVRPVDRRCEYIKDPVGIASERLFNVKPRVYEGQCLTAIDFPVGPVGGGVIRLNGRAEREWWHIFNNFEERPGTGKVPNSFFAIRTHRGDETRVRALQTRAVGPFEPMRALTFQSEFPFAMYSFADEALPVAVSLEAYSFLVPMDLKNSAIPCAVFRYTVKNPGESDVEVGLLAAQQNAVGFTGYGVIQGDSSRQFEGYGSNRNTIMRENGRTSLNMTGNAGSMTLSAYETDMSHSAAWESLSDLYNAFAVEGRLSGPTEATSPRSGVTVDGALADGFTLKPGAEKTVTYVLSWHIPGGSFGRADIPQWYFPEGGCQYENWWANAAEIDRYVVEHFTDLDASTRLYRDALYSSNIPRYVLDRISSNISVLKSPTSFWTRDGYFGIWESTSSKEEWFGNCKHVLHYAQGHARLFPALDRLLRRQDLNSMTAEGLLPARDGQLLNAMDGHFGAVLAVYRAHLLSTDETFIRGSWARVKKAMDYAIETYDADRDGMLSGAYHNTLDCNSSGTSPWMGSMYLAAVRACEVMARVVGDADAATRYAKLFETGRRTQDAQLWNEQLGYYTEKPENLPKTRVMGDAVSIDMFLGQWWANQLGLGQIYPRQRTLQGLRKIYRTNFFTDPGVGYPLHYRDFLGTGDSGWRMFVHPGQVPENTIHYYSEVMSGFEYSMAAMLMKYGLVREGLSVVRTIYDRHDGRLRAAGEVTLAPNATVFGCGSPVGEDECGDFYARPLSSWSTLLALQGFSYDGPAGMLGFKPVWQPEDHASFFTAAEGWGLFTQRRKDGVQTERIDLKYGTLTVRKLHFQHADDSGVRKVTVQLNGQPVARKTVIDGADLRIALTDAITMKAGDALIVTIR